MSRLSSERYLTSVADDVARIAGLVEADDATRPARPVDTCPGWTVVDLVRHLGGVHRMVIRAIEDGAPSVSGDHTDAPGDLGRWFRDGADALLALLAGDPRRPAWAFGLPDGSVGFWQRRQAMEHALHRIDIESTVDRVTATAPDVALDGVAETVEVMVPMRAADLRSVDGAVELRPDGSSEVWQVGSGDVTGTVTGPAGRLFPTLWKRPAADDVADLRLTGTAEALLALPLTP